MIKNTHHNRHRGRGHGGREMAEGGGRSHRSDAVVPGEALMLEKHDVRKNGKSRSTTEGASTASSAPAGANKTTSTKVGRALAGSGATLKSVVRPTVGTPQSTPALPSQTGLTLRRY